MIRSSRPVISSRVKEHLPLHSSRSIRCIDGVTSGLIPSPLIPLPLPEGSVSNRVTGVNPVACTSSIVVLWVLFFRQVLLLTRLGHPSLQAVIPSLPSVSELSCSVCQLSKHHRVSFPPRLDNRRSVPFALVHSGSVAWVLLSLYSVIFNERSCFLFGNCFIQTKMCVFCVLIMLSSHDFKNHFAWNVTSNILCTYSSTERRKEKPSFDRSCTYRFACSKGVVKCKRLSLWLVV